MGRKFTIVFDDIFWFSYKNDFSALAIDRKKVSSTKCLSKVNFHYSKNWCSIKFHKMFIIPFCSH